MIIDSIYSNEAISRNAFKAQRRKRRRHEPTNEPKIQAHSQGHPAKMTILRKFYVSFVPERHFCGVSQSVIFRNGKNIYGGMKMRQMMSEKIWAEKIYITY